MATGDIIQLSIESNQAGQVLVNTYHFKHTGAAPGAGLSVEQALIDEWQAACMTQYRAMFGSFVTVVRALAKHVGGVPPLRATAEESINLAGTRANATVATAAWLAALVREKTAFSGRSFQGRNFYAVGAEDDFTANLLTTNILTPIGAYNTALMGWGGPSGSSVLFRYVTYSRKLAGPTGSGYNNASAEVQSLAASAYMTTMRSRRSRTGA